MTRQMMKGGQRILGLDAMTGRADHDFIAFTRTSQSHR